MALENLKEIPEAILVLGGKIAAMSKELAEIKALLKNGQTQSSGTTTTPSENTDATQTEQPADTRVTKLVFDIDRLNVGDTVLTSTDGKAVIKPSGSAYAPAGYVMVKEI